MSYAIDTDATDATVPQTINDNHEISSPTSLLNKLSLHISPQICISKDLINQMPQLSTKTQFEEIILPEPFQVFCLMHLVEKSIQEGSVFSPKLYVPKEIWTLDQVRLAGIPFKIEFFHLCKQKLEKTSLSLPLVTPEAHATFSQDLDELLEFFNLEKVMFLRAFPFLVRRDDEKNTKAVELLSQRNLDQDDGGWNQMSLTNGLTNLAYGSYKLMKKQAIAVVATVGASPALVTSRNELEEYAATLSAFFNATRQIAQLVGFDDTSSENRQVDSSVTPSILEKLEQLAIFLDEIVMELVIRDVQTLLEVSLRRTSKHYGEFLVEDILTRTGSQNIPTNPISSP